MDIHNLCKFIYAFESCVSLTKTKGNFMGNTQNRVHLLKHGMKTMTTPILFTKFQLC